MQLTQGGSKSHLGFSPRDILTVHLRNDTGEELEVTSVHAPLTMEHREIFNATLYKIFKDQCKGMSKVIVDFYAHNAPKDKFLMGDCNRFTFLPENTLYRSLDGHALPYNQVVLQAEMYKHLCGTLFDDFKNVPTHGYKKCNASIDEAYMKSILLSHFDSVSMERIILICVLRWLLVMF